MLELIRRRDEVFSEKIKNVIYVYSEYQKPFDDVKDVLFTNSLEEMEKSAKPKSLIIFDDLQSDFIGKQNTVISDWFTKLSHHRDISVLLILQNAFEKKLRTVAINTQYLFFFNLIRDQSTIVQIAKQFCPGKSKYLLDAYKRATSKRFGYLMFNFHPLGDSVFRVRSCLYPTPDCELYTPE